MVKINPRRWAGLIKTIERGELPDGATAYKMPQRWVVYIDGINVTVYANAPNRAYMPACSPRIQSFISRVPLSPAPDSQQSDADDSDTASPQPGGDDSRCLAGEGNPTGVADSSSAVGCIPAGESDARQTDDSQESSDGQTQTGKDAKASEGGEGSQAEGGASDSADGVPRRDCGADKAAGGDAPTAAEGTGEPARDSHEPSPPTGEVPVASVVGAATENKGLNPFSISLRARRAHGGVFGSLADKSAQPSRALIDRARAVFSRMLHGGEGDAGPRWRASRIAIKTAGYLRAWSVTDRRDEDGRPAILVLSDVSGSMAAYARDVLQFAQAVARTGLPGGEIVAVAQSNGYPEETLIGGRITRTDDMRVYMDIIARYDIRAIVIAADNDGEEVYRALYDSTSARFYWLHAYCSAVSERIRVVRPGRFPWPEWATEQRLSMAYGCGSAEKALAAMEVLLKRAA